MLQAAITTASGSEEVTPAPVYHAVVRGLERLLVTRVLTGHEAEPLVKLSVDRLCLPSPPRAIAALGLMLTCMYTGKDAGDTGSDTSSGRSEPTTPDNESLIVAMERVTVLFDRIRKGFPCEARVVARILPTFLDDFFPAQDIMNKVIGEFLSSQQPHPQLMAKVLYDVFHNLHERDQQQVVRDWVMLSLSNFTQRTPVAMATWSLTCFFLSASTNPWRSWTDERLSPSSRLRHRLLPTVPICSSSNSSTEHPPGSTILGTHPSGSPTLGTNPSGSPALGTHTPRSPTLGTHPSWYTPTRVNNPWYTPIWVSSPWYTPTCINNPGNTPIWVSNPGYTPTGFQPYVHTTQVSNPENIPIKTHTGH
uniref:Huntingtin n=1 Tax=Branchiostoma floridae TaxID=7739 RepID=C3ZGJ8_BRAFL|eukprot:XP_002592323.1 hypothetical protein BRAFLDRAFT_101262 [Branchiostoma floridae]